MTDIKYENYGEYIKNRRIQLGISQTKIAEVLQCSKQAISKYEKGTANFHLSNIGLLCRILEVDFESFIYQRNEKNNDLCDTNDFSSKEFAKTLSYLRESHHITQKELSEKTNIPIHKLTKYENGKSLPSIEDLVSFATFYKIGLTDLYFSNIGIESKENRKKKRIKEIGNIIAILVCVVLTSASLVKIIVDSVNKGTSSSSIPQPPDKVPPGDDMHKITYLFGELGEERFAYVKDGEYARPLAFDHEGYYLVNYLYNSEPFKFDSVKIYEDYTLIADLQKKEFDVTFFGFENEILKNQKVLYKEAAEAPEIDNVGEYSFMGWDTKYKKITSNTAVNAIYENTDITTHLILNEEEGERFSNGDTHMIIEDFKFDMLFKLPIPIKDGYIFEGWKLNNELVSEETILSSKNYLYPAFIKNEIYKISFTNTRGFEIPEIKVKYGSLVETFGVYYENHNYISHYLYKGEIVTAPLIYNYKESITLEAVWVDGEYEYNILEDNTIELTSVSVKNESVYIPEEIDGYKVSSIKKSTFAANKDVKKITVDAKLKNIDNGVFSTCSQLQILLLNGVDSSTKVGYNILYGCENLAYFKTSNVKNNTNELYKYSDYGISDTTYHILSYNNNTTEVVDMFGPSNTNIVGIRFFSHNLKHIDTSVYKNLKNLYAFQLYEGLETLKITDLNNLYMDYLYLPSSLKSIEGTISSGYISLIYSWRNESLDYSLEIIDEAFVDVMALNSIKNLYLGEIEGINVKYAAYLPNNVYSLTDRNSYPSKDSNFIKTNNSSFITCFYGVTSLPECYESFNWFESSVECDNSIYFIN